MPTRLNAHMDAYELVISVIALNPDYQGPIMRRGLQHRQLEEGILRLAADYNDILEAARIKPHPLHGDSQTLNDALYTLRQYGVLQSWTDGDITWSFPLTPQEYYDQKIKPKLPEEFTSRLEMAVRSL